MLPGVLAAPVRRGEGRDELARARLRVEDGAVRLTPLTGQDSHMIARSAVADVLVRVPRGSGELPVGAAVSYLSL